MSAVTSSERLRTEMQATVRTYFGSHAGNDSHKTVQRVLETHCPASSFSLSEDQAKAVFLRIQRELEVLSNNPRMGSSPWLDNAPYRAARAAINAVKSKILDGDEKKSQFSGATSFSRRHIPAKAKLGWEQCVAIWGQGGRKKAEKLNLRIMRQTDADLRANDGSRFDPRVFSASLAGTQHIPRPAPVSSVFPRTFQTEVEFLNQSTFDAAEKMLKDGYNPLVLDMANKLDIGGAPFKASTQEEYMCRTSTLYAALMQIPNDGERYNRPISQGGILVPQVQVFRDGPEQGYRYRAPFTCDVYAAAAFNCNVPHRGYDKPADPREYIDQTKQKMRDMFRTAHANRNDSLLLGAFGCGAFKNDPYVISQLYADVLAEPEFKGLFRKVTFGITGMGKNNPNLDAFTTVLSRANNQTQTGAQAPLGSAHTYWQGVVKSVRDLCGW